MLSDEDGRWRMNAEHRVIIKVQVKPKTPAGWLAKSKAVIAGATAGGAMFASLAALLAQLASDSQLLDQAQSKAANGGKIETSVRNSQWRALQKSFRAFVGGVQGLCDAASDAAHAQAIAAAAVLGTRLSSVRILPDLRCKVLGNGGVRLYGRRPVPRRAGAFFEWQMSGDGGKTWTSVAITNAAKTQVLGLGVATMASFRYRTTLRDVTSEWCQAVAVLVH